MSAAEVAGLCAAILGVAGVIGVATRLVKAAYRVARRIERIEEHAQQLSPNSGSSLYDKVHRVHEIVHEANQRLDAVEETLADHDAKIHRNQGRIEAIALVTSPTMLIEDEGGVIRESRRKSQDGHTV